MNHPPEDLLDEYAPGRISDEVEFDIIEEHLLVCHECRQLVDAVRLALARTLAAKN